MPSTGTKSIQAQKAAAVRWGKPNAVELGRDYAAARIADYIEHVVSNAPPLTPEQCDRLANLLRGGH